MPIDQSSQQTERETGRCDVCGKIDYLERIPLGHRGVLQDARAVDAKFCEKCEGRIRAFYRHKLEEDEQ